MLIMVFHTSFLFFLSSLLSIVFVYRWLSSASKKTQKNLLPSPRKLPIIGNLHQLGENIHLSLQSLAQKYGPLVLLHLGSVPVLVVSSVNAAKEIMKTHDLIFSSRPKTIASRLIYNCKDVAFAPYGEYWRQVKSICVLQLLSSARVLSFQNVRQEEVDLLIENITESCSKVVNLSELFISLTNDIVSRVALGRKYSTSNSTGGREIGGGKSNIKELMRDLTQLLGVFSVGDYIPWLSWVDRISGLKRREEKSIKRFDDFLEGVVKDHMLIFDDRTNNIGAQDFVDILLDNQKQSTSITGFPIDKETIKAVTMDMFVAGTDSVATTLEWTVAELIRNPNIMRKLQAEVREIGRDKSRITEKDLEKMHYLKAVIKETLRLNTPLPLLVPRVARQNVKVMGYDIAAGTQVIINAWAIARDPSLWDEPEEFRPERFLNSPIDFKGLHFEFLPFGAGRRGCPGIQFAMAITELALAKLVQEFDFALPGGERNEDLNMDVVTGITLHKKSPLLVVATPPQRSSYEPK